MYRERERERERDMRAHAVKVQNSVKAAGHSK